MVTLLEYARLADKVYEPSTAKEPCIAGFRPVRARAVDDRSVFSGGSLLSSGLQMRAFRREAGGDVVIAFKGTKPTMASDLLADLQLTLYAIPRQAVEAYKHTRDWRPGFGGAPLTLVGHSLGGAIAQVVGLLTGIRFVTFNAPGMWSNCIGICGLRKLLNSNRLGMNYIKWGDPIGNFGMHVGDTTRVRSVGHGMTAFVELLATHPARDRDPLG